MPRRFDMLEPVTGRLLGTLDLVEDLQPGEVVRTFFRLDAVQLEVHGGERAGGVQANAPQVPTPAKGRRVTR